MEGVDKSLSYIEREKIQDKEAHEGLGEIVHEIIEKYLEDGSQKIGQGLSAEVHYTGGNQRACIKIISSKTLDSTRKMRSVFQEATIQELVNKTLRDSDIDVIVPKPYFEYEIKDPRENLIENNINVMCMERLNAVSLKEVLEKTAELPDTFNFEIFFTNLRMALRYMHDRNLYHRDLRPGNVMIDIETGNPCIIDFEFSVREIGDEDPYKEIGIDGIKVYPTDESEMNRLRRLMLGYITNQRKS